MSALLLASDVGKVKWKLREALARRKVTNAALAEKIGRHPTAVSRLKSQDILPAIGGEEISKICDAITELTVDNSFGPCSLSELIELDDELGQ